jgi:hypothetical protein
VDRKIAAKLARAKDILEHMLVEKAIDQILPQADIFYNKINPKGGKWRYHKSNTAGLYATACFFRLVDVYSRLNISESCLRLMS